MSVLHRCGSLVRGAKHPWWPISSSRDLLRQQALRRCADPGCYDRLPPLVHCGLLRRCVRCAPQPGLLDPPSHSVWLPGVETSPCELVWSQWLLDWLLGRGDVAEPRCWRPTLEPEVWLPVCNPLHNRSLSPAVNRKPSIATGYQRSGRSGGPEAASSYVSSAVETSLRTDISFRPLRAIPVHLSHSEACQ